MSEVKGATTVEENIELRELEITTRYELKYLSNSLADLKEFVKDRLGNEADKFDILSKKVNWLMYVILLQLAGFDVQMLTTLLKAFPV